jgi:hypothetical protein
MKMRLSRLLAPVVLGAASLALASVHTDFDHHVDFNRYHTYSWIGVQAPDSLWQNRIVAAVDSHLAARGWTRVPEGGEAAVSAFSKTTERDTYQTFYSGFPGWGWGGWGGWDGGIATAETQVVPEEIGNLTVDIFDGGTKQLMWRGTSSKVLSSKPAKNEKKLEHAVADMFEHFPPEPKT